jgi:hypothetical protein
MFPTPTPFAVQTPSYFDGIDVEQFGQNMATGMVQGFNVFDAQAFAGVIWFILLALLIIAGIISIRRHLDTL